ncbi:MAG: hypothetical protein JNK94_01925 [Hyphomonadaceae bacterium]|nr:hypothetical protein [Hyphomonadaceae bacterium]MBX3510095.1 hypothetical protein [Hyphomonadaceae bacterium]
MLICAALATLATVSLAEIPTLATEVESEARALTAQTTITPAFLAGLEDFSGDAMRLSEALREAGVEQDLPCIFRGIAEDAAERVTEFQAADTEAERRMAFDGLRALLNDAILIAPMAAGAATDAAEARAIAAR